ncbi:MAG TPA: hypothetical protein VE733_26900, partial [Streptosporangiaceae bacterium]|nr:hypothetical protein [Streptosporangiaceae bacterium]
DQLQAHKPKIIARQPGPELSARTVQMTELTASRKASAQVTQFSALTTKKRRIVNRMTVTWPEA